MRSASRTHLLGVLLWLLAATLAVVVWMWHIQPDRAARARRAAVISQPSVAAVVRLDDGNVGAPPPTSATPLDELRRKLGETAAPDAVMTELIAVARANPALALDLAHALGRTEAEKSAWVTELAQAWVAADPASAWNWLLQVDAVRMRDLAHGTVPAVMISALARRVPDQLVRDLDALVRRGEMPLGVAPAVAVHLAMEALSDSRPELARTAVESWARDPEHPRIGEGAFVSVANTLARTAPADAAAWLLALPASEQRDVAVTEFPAQWAQSQPAAALDWVERNVPPQLQSAAVQRTFSEWVERDASAASEWLAGYLTRAPAGHDTDRLIGDVVNLSWTLQTSPAVALQWTSLMADPATRASTEERVALRWGQMDRSAALEYVNRSTTIPADRKPALLARLASL